MGELGISKFVFQDFIALPCLGKIPPSIPPLIRGEIKRGDQISYLTYSIFGLKEVINDSLPCWQGKVAEAKPKSGWVERTKFKIKIIKDRIYFGQQ